MSDLVVYTAGGTVQADGGTYLTRSADNELLQLCQQGRFTYVLTARQMGKSSLMIATAANLEEQGIRTAIIDLTQIGTETTKEEEWYFGFLVVLAGELGLEDQLTGFWESHGSLSLTQRFTQFLEAVVLAEIKAPIVVFVDEIDSTLSLGFTDDFFIAIRYFYTARAQNPAFNRLSFVLVGVATPSELISDQKRTPFNIGDRVDLTDFTFNEALPLAQGLGLPEAEGPQVLRWVLAWTGGHPYLTQRLCKEIAEQGRATWIEADLEALTGQLFFGDRREQDNNLQFVRDMLTRRTPDNDVLGVLGTYRQIRRGRQLVLDEDQSVVKAHLKLSGVIKREEQQLQVRNPIYSRVFDLKWVREQWPETWWERLKPAMPLIAVLSAVAVAMGGLAWYANDRRSTAIAAAAEATTERDNARKAQSLADQRLVEANQARQQAEKQQKLAEKRRKEAEAANQEAKEQRQQAVLAQQLEAEQKQRAEAGEAEANKQAGIARDQTALASINLDRAKEATAIAQQETLKAETQALNAEIQAEALTVKNWMAADLTTQAMLKAIALGQRLRTERGSSPLNAELTAIEQSRTSVNKVDSDIPQRVTLQPSTYLQAVSTLRETHYFEGYLQRNTLQSRADIAAYSASFSPDGQTIVSASDDTVKLWDRSGRELQTLQGHIGLINYVSFSPDGQTIASASTDGTVKLWDRSGRELQTLEGHSDGVSRVSFSPDGQTLASASDDGTVKLWDRSGQELQTLEGHSDGVSSVSFSPDGQTLASASDDGTVKLWDRSGQELQTLQGHSRGVTDVSFSPDGQTVASAGGDGTIKLWNRSGQQLQTLPGHRNGVISVRFSPDGQTIASAGSDGTIKLWNRGGRQLQTLHSYATFVYSVSFSPDGQTIVSASADKTIKLWDNSGRELQTLEGHSFGVTSVSFSPDGQTIASSSADTTIKLWDSSGREVQTLQGQNGWVRSVSFSPDGQTIAGASTDGTVKLWDRSGWGLKTLQSHTPWLFGVTSVRFSPDGAIIATTDGDYGTIKLWDNRGRELKTLQGHSRGVNEVSFSPDGQTIASASTDGTVKLWDRSGRELQTLEGHSDGVSSVSFSPDGQTLASASDDGTVKLWDRSGRELQTLEGHSDGINSVIFSPDGQTLASASDDGTVKLWDRSGQELQTLQGHSRGVTDVSFSPDGQTLASASDDRSIILWNFNLDDLMAKSCHWLRDYMTNPATPPEEKALCATELGLSAQSLNPWQAIEQAVRDLPITLQRTYTALQNRGSGS